MPELFGGSEVSQEVIIATIGNQNNPAQVVEIVHLPEKRVFLTRGISTHFNLKEIAVPQNLMLPAIQEMTGVVSYLLEQSHTHTRMHRTRRCMYGLSPSRTRHAHHRHSHSQKHHPQS